MSNSNTRRRSIATEVTLPVPKLPVDSMKVIAETVGVSRMTESAAHLLSEDVTHRVKQLIQDGLKFMEMGKRRTLNTQDIDMALKVRNIEPVYGYGDGEPLERHTEWRVCGGGGGARSVAAAAAATGSSTVSACEELYFIEEKEVDLAGIINASLQIPVPADVTLKVHWLAIDGVQPEVKANPSLQHLKWPEFPQTTTSTSGDATVTVNAQGSTGGSREGRNLPFTLSERKAFRFKVNESVFVKQLAKHPLSAEQQMYFMDVVKACTGSDEAQRCLALQSLQNDPGFAEMLPNLTLFIFQGVKRNVKQGELAFLIYFMRMVKSLLQNGALSLEKYLQDLIPSVLTCILAKQLCTCPNKNHFALREFAAQRMADICRKYSTPVNGIEERILTTFKNALDDPETPLVTMYGVIVTLGEMGPNVVKQVLVPRVKVIGTRIWKTLEVEGETEPYKGNIANLLADKMTSHMIKDLILKMVPPVLSNIQMQGITWSWCLEGCKQEFGFFGKDLFDAITTPQDLR